MKYLNYNYAENSQIYWENNDNNFYIPKIDIRNEYDLVIIGSGLTALSAAYHLDKNKSILIIDKSYIGYGGSSRNGGFCCLGGTKLSFQEIENKYGNKELLKFFHIQKEAIELVKEILEERITTDEVGEIIYYYKESALLKECKDLEKFKSKLNLEYEVLSKNDLKTKRLYIHNNQGAIKMNYGFGINPKNLVYKLIKKIIKNQNVDFCENTEVLSIKKNHHSNFEIKIQEKVIKSKKCILATNGYLNRKNLNKTIYNNIIPALSNIIVTEPIENSEFNDWKTLVPCADHIPLLHYFRLLKDNRIMFGGRGGHSYRDTHTYKKIILNDFNNLFPEFKNKKIEFFWRGLVGVTKDKIAHLGVNDEMYYGYGYNGNGVSLATYFGKVLANLIDKKIYLKDLPDCITRKPEEMPFSELKRFYLFLAYQYYKFKF